MKLIDFYMTKDPDLWLTREVDHHGESIDNSPKAMFLIAIDWWVGEGRPFMYIEKEPRNFYRSFTIKLYLTYWQFYATVRLDKLPYRTKEEYLTWRKNQHDSKRNS